MRQRRAEQRCLRFRKITVVGSGKIIAIQILSAKSFFPRSLWIPNIFTGYLRIEDIFLVVFISA